MTSSSNALRDPAVGVGLALVAIGVALVLGSFTIPGWLALVFLVIGAAVAVLGLVIVFGTIAGRQAEFRVEAWCEPLFPDTLAVSLSSLPATGTIRAFAFVSGKLIANSEIVVANVSVIFRRKNRFRFWVRPVICRATSVDSSALGRKLANRAGVALKPGEILDLGDRTAFECTVANATESQNDGTRWRADLEVELLHPRVTRQFDLDERAFDQSSSPPAIRRGSI